MHFSDVAITVNRYKCHNNRALKTKENRRPQSQRPQTAPVASQVVAMTTNGASGDDKAVQPAMSCFQFEKKKYSNNMVEKVPSIIK